MTTPVEPTPPADVEYETDFDDTEYRGKSEKNLRALAAREDAAHRQEQQAAIRASRKLRTDGNPDNGEAAPDSPIKQ